MSDIGLPTILCCLLPIIIGLIAFLTNSSVNVSNKKLNELYHSGEELNEWHHSGNGKTHYIYRLKDGRKTFYIGRTVNPSARLAQHRRDYNGRTPKQRHIRSMRRWGRTPTMEIIGSTDSDYTADQVERQYIAREGTHNTTHR